MTTSTPADTFDAGTVITLNAGTITTPMLTADVGHTITANSISADLITTPLNVKVWWAMLAERGRAEAKFGIQRLPLGTGSPADKQAADRARAECDLAAANEGATWRDVIAEEVFEAFAEEDPAAFLVEAIQAMGTLYAAIETVIEQHPDITIPPPF